MKEIDNILLGSSVPEVAQILVESVEQLGVDCFFVFNGICLVADTASTVESICADYDRLVEIGQKEWRESPEGIAAMAEILSGAPDDPTATG